MYPALCSVIKPLISAEYPKEKEQTEILASLHQLSEKLALKAEKLCPGHRNAYWRHEHMCSAVKRIFQMDSSNFPGGESQRFLAAICAQSHDLGRILTLISEKEGISLRLKAGIHHGLYSAQIVKYSGIAEQLCPADYKRLLVVLIHHSKIKIPNNLDPGARDLLELLRDADKLEILSQPLEEKDFSLFTIQEIEAIFLSKTPEDRQVQAILGLARENYAKFIDRFLNPNANAEFKSINTRVEDRLTKIMGASLNYEQEGVRAVLEERSAKASLCYDTLPNFYLMHLAMIFDLKRPQSFSEIRNKNLLQFRLDYIERYCPPELFTRIRDNLLKKVA